MLKGIDVSFWQNVGTTDGDYEFVICKATEGVGYTDPKCDQHYQRAKAQGKLLGVYHFARPGYNSAEAEADWFVSQIQGYIGEAILVLDWEVEATWNVAWAKAWLDRVYQKTGVKPLIYMSGSVVTGNDWSSVVEADYGLWIAYWPHNYQYGEGWPVSPNEMTYGTGAWSFWAIWQFSSRDGKLDCDVANMSRENWMKYAAKNGQPDPTPAPSPAPTPTPEPSTGLAVGDKVTLRNLVDYNGTPLMKTRDYYFISELNGNRAVLRADSVNGAVYCAANTDNLEKVGSSAPQPAPTPSDGFHGGDKVTPTNWVDVNGTRLMQTRAYYYISQIIGDSAVLRADNPTDGTIYARVGFGNLRRV